MLASIREYALELLESQGLYAALAQRHLDYFAGRTDKAYAERYGPHRATWLQWIGAELDNLRAAMAWGLDPAADAARAATGARLVLALTQTDFWKNNGRFSEGRRWCEQALRYRRWLEAPCSIGLLYQAGWLAQFQGDHPAADAAYQEGLALARQADVRPQIPVGLSYLGVAAGWQGDYERAEAFLSEAIAVQREVGAGEMTHALAAMLSNLAIVAQCRGEYGRAAALLQETLAFRRAQRDQQNVAACLSNLGNVALSQRDYARAEAAFRESLQIRQALDDMMGKAIMLTSLADLALFRGQPVRGARLYGAAVAWNEAVGFARDASDRQEQERHIAALRELLGEADFAAAWALGASMTLDQAVAYALG
jgi:non-specific serine/threonine protein kinase